MKMIKALVFLCLISVGCFGQGKWTRLADFSGGNRFSQASFVINNEAYMGTGFGGTSTLLSDFWKYDSANDSWTQVVDFPGEGRVGALGFSINDEGFVAIGESLSAKYQDLWKYNPLNNQWTRMADFLGGARSSACVLVINGKAYVVGGMANDEFKQDVWEYDPVSDTWTQKNDFTGGKRCCASSFELDSKWYIGLGFGASPTNSSNFKNDLWEYNASTDQWILKSSIDVSAGSSQYLGFQNNKGHMFINNRFYNYLPSFNKWEESSSIEEGQTSALFALNNKFYVLSYGNNHFYEFDPNFIPALTTLIASTISTSRIDLSWNDEATFEEKYEIHRSTTSNNGFIKVAEVAANVTTYQDQDLDPDITYYYKIKSVNVTKSLESDFSNEASATTSLNANISLQAFSQSLSAVRLAWSSDNTMIDGYKIERSEDEAQGYIEIAEIPVASAAGHIDQNLEPGKTYFYRIRAFKNTSVSQYSNRIGANTLVTGINKTLSQQIKTLNNPNATGFFQIKTEGQNTQNWQAELRDGQMKVLPQNLVLKSNAGYRIDLRQKPSGIYFLILDTNRGKVIKKLLKK
ncbi:MAG TPA: hypothetical protein DCS93_12640 [Microscillaceae bacterium]|nr:hypothetical protein [Microscillaceae bacterium]